MSASTAARPERRRRGLGAALVVSGILVAGCGQPGPASLPPPDPGDLERQLMEADREFAADAAQQGLEGWTAWFADDARQIHVLNAPSPAATASLAIGREIAERALERLRAAAG